LIYSPQALALPSGVLKLPHHLLASSPATNILDFMHGTAQFLIVRVEQRQTFVDALKEHERDI